MKRYIMKKCICACLLVIPLLALAGCGQNTSPAPAIYEESNPAIPYVGAAHQTEALVATLPRPGGWAVHSIAIGQGASPYGLTVFYQPDAAAAPATTQSPLPEDLFEENAAFLFSHIGNLQEVTFSVQFEISGNVAAYDFIWSQTRGGDISTRSTQAMADTPTIFIDQMQNVNLGFNILHEINYDQLFADIRGFAFEDISEQGGQQLVLWANRPIYNLSLIAIALNEEAPDLEFIVTQVVYTLDRLDSASASALVIHDYYGMGTLPASGIAFDDAPGGQGTRRYFTLQQSGMDARFYLNEFSN